MKVQTVKQMLQMQKWAAQVKAHDESGQTVRQWCRENKVAVKSFYYHKKRVQEELLETIGVGNALLIPSVELSHCEKREKNFSKAPVFAELPIPQPKYQAAVTVRRNDIAVEIQNSADNGIVELVLRLVIQS